MECELIDTCGFFAKYRDSKDISCQAFIRIYCQGERSHDCKRKKYRDKYKTFPVDDMMPHGTIIFNFTK